MKSRVGRNTIWLLIARLSTHGLLAAFTVLIARRLGEVGLGQYAFIASVMFVANALTTFGTDMLLIREIAGGSDLSRLPAALVIQLSLSVVFVVAINLLSPWLPNLDSLTKSALQLYSVALFPLAFFTIFTTALRGLERMDWYTLLNLVVSILQTVGAWIFVQSRDSIVSVAWVLVVVQFLAAGLAGGVCAISSPNFYRGWRFAWSPIPPLLKASAPIAWLAVLGMIYQRASIYQITALAGAAATGGFSAAARIVEASKTGHLALFGALYPVMAQAQQRSQSTLKNSGRLLFGAAVLGAVLMALLAGPMVHILFGDGFESSIGALRVMAWQIIPYTVSTYLSLLLLATGRERWVGRALGVSVIVLIGLNVWWVPLAGIAGACWAVVVTETIQAILLLYTNFRTTKTIF